MGSLISQRQSSTFEELFGICVNERKNLCLSRCINHILLKLYLLCTSAIPHLCTPATPSHLTSPPKQFQSPPSHFFTILIQEKDLPLMVIHFTKCKLPLNILCYVFVNRRVYSNKHVPHHIMCHIIMIYMHVARNHRELGNILQ